MYYLVVNYLLFIFEYNQTNKKVKKNQIKSRSEYKITGYTLENMLEMAYSYGRIDQKYHPDNVTDSIKKDAVARALKIGCADVFEILDK